MSNRSFSAAGSAVVMLAIVGTGSGTAAAKPVSADVLARSSISAALQSGSVSTSEAGTSAATPASYSGGDACSEPTMNFRKDASIAVGPYRFKTYNSHSGPDDCYKVYRTDGKKMNVLTKIKIDPVKKGEPTKTVKKQYLNVKRVSRTLSTKGRNVTVTVFAGPASSDAMSYIGTDTLPAS